jgi:hypothetical protein
MTFLAPGFLWGAIAAAAGLVALHFIVTRQPRAALLPTARFVPDTPATATARDVRPSDLLLLLLRVLIVLAAGAALARPVMKPSRRADGRVILLDASRSAASLREVVDSSMALYRDGDAVVVFDSSARSLGPRARDSLGSIGASSEAGNLSAALIAGLREASALRDRVDSVELVIVSPLLAEERDAATDSIRKLWPGRARLVRVAAQTDSAPVGSGPIVIRSIPDDPLTVAVSIASKQLPRATARIVRNATITAEDTAWASSDAHVLVTWPVDGRPSFAIPRTPVDPSGGILSGNARLIAAFDRRWRFPTDSLRAARVVARWADGEPAAIEKRLGQGCIRSVAVPVAAVGDLVIRSEFVALVKEIAGPCGEPRSMEPLASAVIASLSGRGGLAPSDAFRARQDVASPLAPWLFGIALAAALVELFVRRISPVTARRGPIGRSSADSSAIPMSAVTRASS